jgi:hypothetical protein
MLRGKIPSPLPAAPDCPENGFAATIPAATAALLSRLFSGIDSLHFIATALLRRRQRFHLRHIDIHDRHF